MIKRTLLLMALIVAVAFGVSPSSAESVCVDAGATGLTPKRVRLLQDGGVRAPTVCVPVP